MNKKGKVDDHGKKRSRKAQKFQKAIVGMTLDDIKKKKAQKPELRQAAREAAAKEQKARMQKKAPAAGAKPVKAAPKKQQGGAGKVQKGGSPAGAGKLQAKGKQ